LKTWGGGKSWKGKKRVERRGETGRKRVGGERPTKRKKKLGLKKKERKRKHRKALEPVRGRDWWANKKIGSRGNSTIEGLGETSEKEW